MRQHDFLQAKACIAVLQAAAVGLQQGDLLSKEDRQQLVQVLRALQQLHKLVTKFLSQMQVSETDIQAIVDHETAVAPSSSADFPELIGQWQKALPQQLQILLSTEHASVHHYLKQRQQALIAEAADNQQAAKLLGLDQQTCTTLAEVVAQLRSVESSVLFQAILQQQVAAAAAGDVGYSCDNFAYNSTPFASWAKVHSNPQVAAAIQQALASIRNTRPSANDNSNSSNSNVSLKGRSKTYMVWGSSIGWLALYAGLTYRDCRVVGIELLPVLVQIAQQAADMADLTDVSFRCQDLLESDLTGVGVLMVTEQCWDQQLVEKACLKLQTELPEHAVVVDYTGAIGKAGLCCSLEVVVEVSVGWNQRQQMHAYVKR